MVQRERITACWTHKRTSTLSFTRLRDFPAAFFMLRVRYGNKYTQPLMGRVLTLRAFLLRPRTSATRTRSSATRSCCRITHRPLSHHAPRRASPNSRSRSRITHRHATPRHHQPQLPHPFPHAPHAPNAQPHPFPFPTFPVPAPLNRCSAAQFCWQRPLRVLTCATASTAL